MKIIVTRFVNVRSKKHNVSWTLEPDPDDKPQTFPKECCDIAIARKAAVPYEPKKVQEKQATSEPEPEK